MLLTVVLLITALVSHPTTGDLQKTRELNLDVDNLKISGHENNSKNETKKTDLLSSKLISSLSPSGSSQNQQNTVKILINEENLQTVCNPPFNTALCKEFSNPSPNNIIDNIPKPSRDLVPPYSDLQEGKTVKSPTTLLTYKEDLLETTITDNTFSPVGASSQISLISTTIQPLKQDGNGISVKKQTTNLPFTDVSGFKSAEATNELRSYLPPQPEISVAAQNSVAFVQKPDQPNDHDHHHGHHGHHHDENFDICSDSFHSFLCAPLKARKRITGALPSQFSAQGSFVRSQKVLPNPEEVPASSNSVRNEYLPPVSASVRNEVTFQTKPTVKITTSPRPYSPPKAIPILNDRLPPRPSNIILSKNKEELQFSSTTQKPISITSPVTAKTNKTPKQQFLTTKKPLIVTTTTEKFVENTLFPVASPFAPLPSNENRFYLPPKVNIETLPTAPTFISPIYLSGKPKVEPAPTIISTTIQPTLFTVTTVTTKPPVYIPPKASFKPILQPQANVISTTIKPIYTTKLLPKLPSKSPNIFKPTTVKPSPSKFSVQSTNVDRSYLPPDPNIQPAAAQVNPAIAAPENKNPFHHGRDLCTDPFHSFLCSETKPRKRITGALPSRLRPESSNAKETRLKPEPSFQSENRIKPGYQYPKPENSVQITTRAPSTGYSYPKPEKEFPLPSVQREVVQYTTSKPVTTRKPDLITLKTSEAKVVTGYQYPKPEESFTLPNKITTVKPNEGYSYPKPKQPFPLPTEVKETRYSSPKPSSVGPDVSLPTNQVQGYQYPKPQQSFNLPEKKGYSYPKPEKRLELPTETGEKSFLPQTNSKLSVLGNLNSAEFIPVNKLDSKRDDATNLFTGIPKFGERVKKRVRSAFE